VLSTTACIYGLSTDALRGRSRRRDIAEARAIAAFLSYELTGASYRVLGVELDRDRAWICRMVDRVAERLRLRDRKLTSGVASVEAALVADGA
jgi:chromosomal replication initiation ATPase DnaA